MITLRDVTEADLAIFFEHQREPEANRMAAFPPRDRDAFLAHWRTNILGNDAVVKRTVLCAGEVAGNVGCFEQAGRHLVGYWIGKAFWGRGVATAALSQLVAAVEIRPLHAFVAKSNVGSVRVLEKCGFVRIGEQAGPHADEAIAEWVYELSGGA